MKIAVIIPSRLALNSATGKLWLYRAVGSIRRQTVAKDHDLHIVVGVDDDGRDLRTPGLTDLAVDIAVGGHSQAEAVNAAAQMALTWKPDLLAFLEDDDAWHPEKLSYQLAAIERGFDFVSCSQREVDPDGNYIRVNDFSTCSGWLLPVHTWLDVGPMDTLFKWHIDTEWIGRLNAAGKKRLHLAEHAANVAYRATAEEQPRMRPWLANVAQNSKVAMTDGLLEPLVARTVHPGSGMARIATDPIAGTESHREHQILWQRFGATIPW